MRQQLMQVLGSEDQDTVTTHVLERFWTRAKPLPARFEHRPDAKVVDLATWAKSSPRAGR